MNYDFSTKKKEIVLYKLFIIYKISVKTKKIIFYTHLVCPHVFLCEV